MDTQRLNTYKYKPEVRNADSRTIDAIEEFDMVFSCPPYWDVEDYNKLYGENLGGSLSEIKTYADFLHVYQHIIAKCHRALKPGKYAVWVVGDIRRDKTLIPFAADSIRIFMEVGFTLHDVIINKLNSMSVMGVGSALDNKYTPKMHEYILVFKKNEVSA